MLHRLVSDSLIKKNPIFVECLLLASQVALVVKNPPANAGDIKLELDHRVGKIPWRKVWQPIPVFLPSESPWTEEPGGLQSMGSQRVEHD